MKRAFYTTYMENLKIYFNCFNSMGILLPFLEALLWQIVKAVINILDGITSQA